jgi:dTMP kinase
MTTPGKLIAIEGIDGSGKRTQLELLEKALAAHGLQTYSTGFPQYVSHFGKMVGRFLNGDFGDVESLDPRLTAMLYAGDRFEAKPVLTAALQQGKVVLVDRYIGSNLAHQTARVPVADRDEFINWVEHLEYNIYGLPREDLVLYLRVPPPEAHALVGRKSARSYTTAKRDILEASLRHLEEAAELYDFLARRSHWAIVQCFDDAKLVMRPPDAIAQDVLSAVESLLANRIPQQPAPNTR